MRKTDFSAHSWLLAAAFFLSMAFSAGAQEGKVTVNLKDASLKEFFNSIEGQTHYTFSYRDSEVEGKTAVTVNVKDTPLAGLLQKELAKAGLRYALVNGKIVVTPMSNGQDAAPIVLNGRIVDKSGQPVIGASALIKGTVNGVVTDMDGKFSIKVSRGEELVFSSLGYIPYEYKVGRLEYVDITLEDDAQLLDEAVAVGYGTTLRKNLTTSIATVKADDLSKSAASNVSQMLMGKAAGLRANISSPQPGGNVDISIRGGGTPIYIVDGIMMPSGSLEVGNGSIETPNSINRAGLAGLNPGDIESIEVLKDASAAIYGINAANGVILITTKKGSEGAPRVTLEANYSFVRNYRYLQPLCSTEYMNFANIFSKESYLMNHDMYPYGANQYDEGWSPVFYPDQIASATDTDWLDYILRSGSINNHSVSITGGSKYVKYYIGGNYYDQVGTVINSRMQRYTLRSNISAQVFPFLKLNAILNVNSNSFLNSNADGGGAGGVGKDALQSALMFPPNYPVYDEEGNYMRYRTVANPAEMKMYNDRTNTSGWYTNFSADLNLWKDIIMFRGVYGFNRENAKRSLYVPTDMMWYEVAGVSRGHLGDAERSDQTLEGMLMYRQDFAGKVNVEAVLGMGMYNSYGSGLEVDYRNANDNIGPDNIAAAEGPFTPTSSKWANEKRSQFARVSVDILDRYVISGTVRRDGTDKFFPGKKYAWFPSVSAAWKISNETFMKGIRWIDLLKLRASYGVTGRDNLGTSLYGLYSMAPSYVKFDNNSVSYIPYIKSGADYPDVSWEKTIMKNVGLDFHLLKNRLWGSVDVFRNDVTDLLGEAPGEPLSMTGTRPVNYGHYYRSGVDVAINSLNIKSAGGFTWSTALTLTHYNMYWVERTQNYDYKEYQIRDREPMNASYFYHVTGIINADRSNMPDSQYSLGENSQRPGYPIIEDRNGDGIIGVEDIYMDDVLPKISIGFGNTFTYKNFDLDIFLYGQFGATKYNYAFAWANAGALSYGPPQNSNQYAYRIWNSQTNPDGTLPGIATTRSDALPGDAGWDLGRENASFVRVRNITLGYNLDGKILGKVLSKRIDGIRIFFDAQNPFTFTGFSGIDPEIYTGNSSSPAGYPMVRSYSLGAKINFK
ncbi:MAG: SusC/RagA family TonB-linked outer membrane protein [Clostridium sp.]|nr:SusC/RagA family TonB-linked outer membrane protein [Bacteroides sp.]MCM1198248.1 SusC/RagA family TonB-linked outer membrane protein [Clostridium sp.]